MEHMDTQTTSTEEMLRTLLAHTAVSQAGIEALQKSVSILQNSVNELQVDTASIKATTAHHATQAEVERIRVELYKTMEAQTWRLFVSLTAVCSGLTAAVYFIARNVH